MRTVGSFNGLMELKERNHFNKGTECGLTLQINTDRVVCLDIQNSNMFTYRISGNKKLLMLIDRNDLSCGSIEWTEMNNTWEWAMLDAGNEGVSLSFYTNLKEKEGLIRAIDRKIFGKSVLELLWVYIKENEPLYECGLKWI